MPRKVGTTNTSASKKRVRKSNKYEGRSLKAISEIEDIDLYKELCANDPTHGELFKALEEACEEYRDVVQRTVLTALLHSVGLGAVAFKSSELNLAEDQDALHEFLTSTVENNAKTLARDFEVPLESRKPELRTFTQNFNKFWAHAFSDQSALLARWPENMEDLAHWLTEFSRCKIRQVRSAALSLGTILVEKSREWFKTLIQKREEESTRATIAALDSFLDKICTEVVLARHSDTYWEIRVRSAQLFGTLIEALPLKFLTRQLLLQHSRLAGDENERVRSAYCQNLVALLRSLQRQRQRADQHVQQYIQEVQAALEEDDLLKETLIRAAPANRSALLALTEITQLLPNYVKGRLPQVLKIVRSAHESGDRTLAPIFVRLLLNFKWGDTLEQLCDEANEPIGAIFEKQDTNTRAVQQVRLLNWLLKYVLPAVQNQQEEGDTAAALIETVAECLYARRFAPAYDFSTFAILLTEERWPQYSKKNPNSSLSERSPEIFAAATSFFAASLRIATLAATKTGYSGKQQTIIYAPSVREREGLAVALEQFYAFLSKNSERVFREVRHRGDIDEVAQVAAFFMHIDEKNLNDADFRTCATRLVQYCKQFLAASREVKHCELVCTLVRTLRRSAHAGIREKAQELQDFYISEVLQLSLQQISERVVAAQQIQKQQYSEILEEKLQDLSFVTLQVNTYARLVEHEQLVPVGCELMPLSLLETQRELVHTFFQYDVFDSDLLLHSTQTLYNESIARLQRLLQHPSAAYLLEFEQLRTLFLDDICHYLRNGERLAQRLGIKSTATLLDWLFESLCTLLRVVCADSYSACPRVYIPFERKPELQESMLLYLSQFVAPLPAESTNQPAENANQPAENANDNDSPPLHIVNATKSICRLILGSTSVRRSVLTRRFVVAFFDHPQQQVRQSIRETLENLCAIEVAQKEQHELVFWHLVQQVLILLLDERFASYETKGDSFMREVSTLFLRGRNAKKRISLHTHECQHGVQAFLVHCMAEFLKDSNRARGFGFICELVKDAKELLERTHFRRLFALFNNKLETVRENVQSIFAVEKLEAAQNYFYIARFSNFLMKQAGLEINKKEDIENIEENANELPSRRTRNTAKKREQEESDSEVEVPEELKPTVQKPSRTAASVKKSGKKKVIEDEENSSAENMNSKKEELATTGRKKKIAAKSAAKNKK